MIVERCRQLNERLDSLRRARDAAEWARPLEALRNELVPARAALVAAVGQAAFLRGRELLRKRDLPRTATAAKSVAEVRGELSEPATLAEGKSSRGLLKNLERFTASLREKSAAAWRGWVEVETPTAEDDRLRRLDGLPGQEKFTRQLQESYERVGRLAEEVPATAEQFEAASAVLAEWRELLARVPALLDQAEVEAFLTAVAAGGAPLILLTDAVVAWLRAGDHAERLYVVRFEPVPPATASEPPDSP
jgi:hypothetical protein